MHRLVSIFVFFIYSTRAAPEVVIWSTDFHIAPIADLKFLSKDLNMRVIDKSLSGHCGYTRTCAQNLKVLTKDNAYFTSDDPSVLAHRVYEAYKDDPEFKRVNAVVCFLPLSTCELYAELNTSLIMIAPVRYEAGQEEPHQWIRFNKFLQRVAKNPRHFIGANSVYDAEYIRYFTGIKAEYVPSFCGNMVDVYSGSKSRTVLLAHSHVPGSGLVWNVAEHALRGYAGIRFRGISEGGRYTYADLARTKAIVHFPYQVSVMSFFEQYKMGIPLFVPSLNFLVKLHMDYGLVSERTWSRIRTGVAPKGSPIPKHPDYDGPDPNDDTSPNALRYWLNFSDFYVLPHIQYFNSFAELAYVAEHFDAVGVSAKMMKENERRHTSTVRQWKRILKRVTQY